MGVSKVLEIPGDWQAANDLERAAFFLGVVTSRESMHIRETFLGDFAGDWAGEEQALSDPLLLLFFGLYL